jgi:hypothetical protein
LDINKVDALCLPSICMDLNVNCTLAQACSIPQNLTSSFSNVVNCSLLRGSQQFLCDGTTFIPTNLKSTS